VGNKVRSADDAAFLQANPLQIPILGLIPADDGVAEADRLGTAVYDTVPALRAETKQMIERLETGD